MQRLTTACFTAALTTALLISSPADARRGYDSTVTAPIAGAVQLDVKLSDDLAYRADNLPKKLSDRGSGIRSTGFGSNGYYGQKDLDKLTVRLENRLAKQLGKRGITVDDNAPTVMRVVITDARNSRPTFRQLSKDPGLSYRSVANGGATIDAQLIQAGGAEIGTISYQWYEDDIRDAQYSGTWTDAHRAMDRFAKKAAKDLSQSLAR